MNSNQLRFPVFKNKPVVTLDTQPGVGSALFRKQLKTLNNNKRLVFSDVLDYTNSSFPNWKEVNHFFEDIQKLDFTITDVLYIEELARISTSDNNSLFKQFLRQLIGLCIDNNVILILNSQDTESFYNDISSCISYNFLFTKHKIKEKYNIDTPNIELTQYGTKNIAILDHINDRKREKSLLYL